MIEHELSGKYDVSHGAGLAVLFPAWMKYVYHNDVDRFIQFSTRVFDVEFRKDDLDWVVLEGIKRLQEFFSSMGMPSTLRELGVKKEDLNEMAELAAEHGGGAVGNFAVLGAKEIKEIYEIAF